MRTNRRGGAVFLWWVVGCVVGGALAGLGLVTSFFGDLVLFGGLLGVAQALVLRLYLPGSGPSWAAASLFGWVAGSVVQAFFYELLPAPGFAGGGLLVESLPWAALGVGQGLVLSAAVGLGRSLAPLALLWAAASVIGGVLTEAAVVLTTSPFYDALRGDLGELGTTTVQLAVLVATLYAVPTGLVLVGIFCRANGVAGEAGR